MVDPSMDRRLQERGGRQPRRRPCGRRQRLRQDHHGRQARSSSPRTAASCSARPTRSAAAVDQLATWGERVGVAVVRGPEGTDPASVAFEAVKEGVGTGVDTVIVDTAGRLQNKQGLADELGKVKRVIEKQAPVTEVLLVLDATTGQNGLIRGARVPRGRRRDRHRAHQARRLGEGRHRGPGPA